MSVIARVVVLTVALCGALGFAAQLRPTPIAARGPCDVQGADRQMDAAETTLLQALNAYRASKGVGPLQADPLLRKTALWKATAGMNQNAPFNSDADHYDHDLGERWIDVRQNDCGYEFITARGENLGRVDADPAIPPEDEAKAIFDAWKQSPVHEAVQTSTLYRAIGIARVERHNGTAAQSWWAIEFGGITNDRGVPYSALDAIALPDPAVDPCLPADGQSACDEERLRKWLGDEELWFPLIAEDGIEPTSRAVVLYTLKFREQAGSEASRAILRQLGVLR